MPGTPGNRAEFGSAGTADDSAPCPQLRDLLVSDASSRGALAVVTGPSGGDKAAAEQALLDRALTERTCSPRAGCGSLTVTSPVSPGSPG